MIASCVLHTRALPGNAIVRDYQAGRDLSPYFSGHWTDPAAYARKAADVDARLDAVTRMRVAAAIEAHGDAATRLQRILAGDGYFITTGQQPALFGGPLYTLYKILGAIRLAEVAERRLGKPVLALFWNGADDHDWEEANHTVVLDQAKYARRIEVRSGPDASPLPLYQRTWGKDIERALREFAGYLAKTDFARDVLRHVQDSYSPDATVSASFAATLRWLLRDRRVAFVESSHPALRAAAVPVMLREVERSTDHAELVAAQTRRLEAAGYDAQVAVADGAANLMRSDAQGRDRLVRRGNGWGTRRSARVMSDGDLRRDIAADPGSYSPNVLLRPVVENAVFPTIAYVAGPGELGYFAQIGCLFQAHGILPPVVAPRPSLTVVDEKTSRKLAALGLSHEALQRPFEDVVDEIVAAAMPAAVTTALTALRHALRTEHERLAAAAESIDPTLRGPALAARNRALLESNDLEKRILSRLRQRSNTRLEQLRRLAAAIQPLGLPQERTFGPLPLVAAYGPAIIDQIAQRIDMERPAAANWTGPDCG